ncbi:MAG: DNA-3-methyladenine glycosylase [Treponema sp.]|jgi:DNA-3-methyladenine glycosylase II|nr:DNA-3-methyladenine glycosylase [Treponema sp.]
MPERYFVYGEKETGWLKSRDPVLGAAIDAIGPVKRAVIPDLFMALVNSIIGQQISTKAHITIWKRVLRQFSPLTPETIDAAPEEAIQACGTSLRKARYIKEIAASLRNGSLDLKRLRKLPDDEVCERLVQIKGIGVWTAEMLMIFSLQRPDVMSRNDLAIIRGLRMLYHHRAITPKLFAKYKKRYSPYSTTASLYLWAIAGGALS